MMFQPAVAAAIHAAAETHQIEAELVAAFVAVESQGDPNVPPRYEAATWKYIDTNDLLRLAVAAGATEMEEAREQMMSWGMLQVMGFNLRFLGYRGRLLDLRGQINPALAFGCSWLRHLQAMFSEEIPPPAKGQPLGFSEALACAYNHGSPHQIAGGKWIVQPYVDKVKAHYRDFKAHGIPTTPAPRPPIAK